MQKSFTWGPGFELSRLPVALRPPQPKADYNPYEGREVTGRAEVVLSRGRVIVQKGQFLGKPGAGSFLKRSPRIA